ncbi:uncharacterized protein LOC123660760 isoform X2 [Melitaea cinxia]|uniref:uncharacterized protein LOC123660760 isoform X2 n=1 Tax=Melitaea cinxia TaxID=113334 RepID=UPI001E274250|nr:uncharacterized protein LOC123660760 isoform X2 [Melitaea cinxia]
MPSSGHSCYFSKCCFCIDLKTGCFILAYLNLVGVIISIILTGVGLGAIITLAQSNPELKHAIPAAIGLTSVLLIFMILALAFSIVLLVGLHKDKPEHVKSYLIFNGIFVGIYAVLLIITIILGQVTVQMICTRILQILITIYFLLVIRSYYIDMKSNRNRRTEKV